MSPSPPPPGPPVCQTLPKLGNDWVRVEAVRYPPGLYMPPHAHERLGASVVVAGTLVETAGGVEEVCGAGSVVLKPARMVHADRFGPAGATLVSVTPLDVLDLLGLEGAPPALRRWRWASAGAAVRAGARLAAALCVPDDAEAVEEAAAALLGAFDDDPLPRGAPPRWLARVRERLHDDPSRAPRVSALAREAGVHPVYLTRRFRQHFGASVTGYRAALQVARARALLARGVPPSRVAQEAGFADQSHLSRAFRAGTGVTPGAFARSMRAVAREVAQRGREHPAVTDGWIRSRRG